MSGRQAPFALYGERLAFKHAEDQEVTYASVCSYDEYYVNRGQRSAADFCIPCADGTDNWASGRITLGVQDGQCMTCTQLEEDEREIPQFFYRDLCSNLPDCQPGVLQEVGDHAFDMPPGGIQ